MNLDVKNAVVTNLDVKNDVDNDEVVVDLDLPEYERKGDRKED